MKNQTAPWVRASGVLCVCAALGGCATPQQTNLLAGVTTSVLGVTPTTNIVQTYYLGVFDPREQLPPTLYRVRIQGQGSALSFTKFASGWVRADLIDSLSGQVAMDRNGTTLQSDSGNKVKLLEDAGALNRRLIMFGPEGFREAPKNHRLVVVMGSSPETFFSSMDQALGVVAGVTQPTATGPDVLREIAEDKARMGEERRATQTLLDLMAKE